jgi:hypothetical protein
MYLNISTHCQPVLRIPQISNLEISIILLGDALLTFPVQMRILHQTGKYPMNLST